MWGGCFTQETASSLAEINSSINIDKRMFKEDIDASKIYAKALMMADVISGDDYKLIIDGLQKVKSEWENGTIQICPKDEDVHSVNERRLRELIGEAADRLHTGRSRNDQVATDVRLWMLNNIPRLLNLTTRLIEVYFFNIT